VCQNLFRYAPAAWTKGAEWTTRPELLVRRAASWALRAIGKRSPGLHRLAIDTAEQMQAGSRAPRWVGADALRELNGPAVLRRLGRTGSPPSGA
jgi:hypothetical protein